MLDSRTPSSSSKRIVIGWGSQAVIEPSVGVRTIAVGPVVLMKKLKHVSSSFGKQ
jgi:hypothetical protein